MVLMLVTRCDAAWGAVCSQRLGTVVMYEWFHYKWYPSSSLKRVLVQSV